MQDQGDVEEGQAAVHKYHLVDQRRWELVTNFAEKWNVDDAEQAGADDGTNAEVEPLTSGVLGHFYQTTCRGHLLPLYNLGPRERWTD